MLLHPWVQWLNQISNSQMSDPVNKWGRLREETPDKNNKHTDPPWSSLIRRGHLTIMCWVASGWLDVGEGVTFLCTVNTTEPCDTGNKPMPHDQWYLPTRIWCHVYSLKEGSFGSKKGSVALKKQPREITEILTYICMYVHTECEHMRLTFLVYTVHRAAHIQPQC